MDELTTLFQDQFDLDSFLGSLKTFHGQLGSSSVLLTTRNSLLIEDSRLEELQISKYELLGFDSSSCEKYISRRFRVYENSSAIVQKVLAQIEKVRLHDHEKRVVPFFAAIVATVVEDQLRENFKEDFQVERDPTPYPSNNELTDHIIHSVLRREETRHGLDISVQEVIQLISGLVVDFGKRWPALEMRERLELLYDTRGISLYSKISLSPLLIQNNVDIELRYSFLSSYFEVIYLLDGIVNKSIDKGLVRSLSRLAQDGTEFSALRSYFLERQDTFYTSLKELIHNLKKVALSNAPKKTVEKEAARKAIATLLNLYSGMRNNSMSSITQQLLELYGQPTSSAASVTIDGLFISGGFPALDFTNLTITNSKFLNYGRFLSSKFSNTKFLYTNFEGCGYNGIKNTALDESMIDKSCDLGDLRNILDLSKSGKQEEARMIEVEAKKFLHSFFKGDRFIDNNCIHIRFSNKVSGIARSGINRLITNDYLQVKQKKEVDTFYEIVESFRPSVRRLLADNYIDVKMRAFLLFVRN